MCSRWPSGKAMARPFELASLITGCTHFLFFFFFSFIPFSLVFFSVIAVVLFLYIAKVFRFINFLYY